MTKEGEGNQEGSQRGCAGLVGWPGVPLLEIVSGPDLGSGLEAAAYGEELRRVVTYLGVSLANMQVCFYRLGLVR